MRQMVMRMESSSYGSTRSSLLRAVKTGDEVAWTEFHTLYRPLIAWAAGRLGLTGAAVDDVAQQVMTVFFQGRDRFTYDRGKGRFRDYLYTVTRNTVWQVLRKKRLERETPDGSFPEDARIVNPQGEPRSPETLDDEWERQHREILLAEALEILRGEVEPTTYQAFHLFCLSPEPKKAKEVAGFLGLSESGVYVAKHRIVRRLKEIIHELEQA